MSSEVCNLLTATVWKNPVFPVQYDVYSEVCLSLYMARQMLKQV